MDFMGSYHCGLHSISGCIVHRIVPSLPQDSRKRVLCEVSSNVSIDISLLEYQGYPQEWFPSVSATIGDRYPERAVFQLFIAITSGK